MTLGSVQVHSYGGGAWGPKMGLDGHSAWGTSADSRDLQTARQVGAGAIVQRVVCLPCMEPTQVQSLAQHKLPEPRQESSLRTAVEYVLRKAKHSPKSQRKGTES